MGLAKSRESVIADLSSHIRLNKSFFGWMGALTALLLVCVGAYVIQLQEGMIVTGLRDYVSWGLYIANFVFCVAVSLVGMLVSSVLILSGKKWAVPISRIAEVIAVAFAMVAGLVIISDMGRPDRLHHVFVYGRIQSPILWDLTVVNLYVIFSLLLFLVPMIPDLHLLKGRFSGKLAILNKVYDILSFGYVGKPKQLKTILHTTRLLAIVMIPLAFGIHTVTSWLFAATLRVGWDSTVFGPYFVSGAFVAGVAAVVLVMAALRKYYGLKDYFTNDHYNQLGKLLFVVSMLYLYFNINEYFVPLYTNKRADATHMHHLLHGQDALMFWFTQIACLLIPTILMLVKKFRTETSMVVISVFVLIGAWLKRYLIVIPTQESPFLPIQNVPEEFVHYSPTLVEILITLGPIVLAMLIGSTFLKLFPVVPVAETIEELEHKGELSN